MTSTIENNGDIGANNRGLLEAFGHDMTEAARRRAVANNKVFPDSHAFDGSISSDDKAGE